MTQRADNTSLISLHMLTYFNIMHFSGMRSYAKTGRKIPERLPPPGTVSAFQDSRSSLSLIFGVHSHGKTNLFIHTFKNKTKQNETIIVHLQSNRNFTPK